MKRKIFIALATLTALFLLSNSLFAEKTVKERISEKFSEKKDICHVIQRLIWEGVNTQEVVKASIEMGYNACLVIKCAIEGDGVLEQIIAGALQTGVTHDVISRCAIDAGAKPDEVAMILEGKPEISIGLPGGGTGGGVVTEPAGPLSPSSP